MKRIPLLITILIIAAAAITLIVVFHNSTLESSKYNQSCKVEFTTESNLTLNTDLTNMSKHLTELSEFITASDGNYNGVAKYEWQQDTYGDGHSFDIYYDFDDYDIILKTHTHCYVPFMSPGEVHSIHAELMGADSIFFETKAKRHSHNSIEQGRVEVKGPQTAFWFMVAGESNDKVYFEIGSLSGQIKTDGTPMELTKVSADTYEIKICDSQRDNCASDEIYIDTTMGPTVSCKYDDKNNDGNTPYLLCSSTT